MALRGRVASFRIGSTSLLSKRPMVMPDQRAFRLLRSAFVAVTCIFAAGGCPPLPAQSPNDVDRSVGLPTVAESSGYTATATDLQVENFLRRLASQSRTADLRSLGNSVEGRPIWALVLEPERTTSTKPLSVMMLGGIHAGECDGKEALLSLARDLALSSENQWRQSLRLIFVPNLNTDGNGRRGTLHRPGQVGPEQGVGIRENAQGLDLNRDFVKLQSPEIRSVVAALNEYDVDVLIDTHTTNGSLHRYDLTYDLPHNPNTPREIDHWLRHSLLPKVDETMRAQEFSTFYYGNFDEAHRRWTTFGTQPRYSTEYMGLRGRIGILVETYAYANYQRRVTAAYAFVNQLLRAVADDATGIRQLLDTNDSSAPRSVAVRSELSPSTEQGVVAGYQTASGAAPQAPFGADSSEGLQEHDYTVEVWNRGIATLEISAAEYYVVPAEFGWAVSRLLWHGIQVQQLTREIEIDAERYRVLDTTTEANGDRRWESQVATAIERANIPAGSYLISTRQPLGRLAAYLLEPQSEDGLAYWGFFEPQVREGEYFPVWRVHQEVSEEALQKVRSAEAREQLTLEKLFKPAEKIDYGGHALAQPRWRKQSSEYLIEKNEQYLAVDAASGARRPLVEVSQLAEHLSELEAFSEEQAHAAATLEVFSDNLTHALISHQNDLYFFDAEQQVVRQLTHSPDAEERLAELSPTGTHAAFVRDNNLWLVNCETTELQALTEDGSAEVLNGVLDWVYQEELYGRGNFKGFWWSPDGQKIAMLRLDQSGVDRYQVSDSISYRQSLEETRYPKVGAPLPIVEIGVVDIARRELRLVALNSFPSEDRLVARVSWSPAGKLWIQVLNRVQNRQTLLRVESESLVAHSVLVEESPGWIEIRGVPHFLADDSFLWLSDLPSGRTHLFHVSPSGEQRQLTDGEWDVFEIKSISNKHRTAFVTGNQSHLTEVQLLAVDLQVGSTVQITAAPGTHAVQIDHSGKFFIDTFSSKHVPPYISVHAIDGQLLHVIDAPVSDRHEYLETRPPQLMTIPARDDFELQAELLLPAGVDPAEPEQRLPVLFYVYGGPQAATVRNAWGGRNYWWHQFLCQQGYAVVLCDNRAARGRGVSDTWRIRGDMGRVEMEDLHDAVEWAKRQPWADPDRIGLWGWSYGGYFTAYAMTHSDLFTAGIAGAPVTDWRNYDAIYTERYMGLLDENPAGYDTSSVVESAQDLHGRLLIIHGERDDNVHMSNTLQLAHALQMAGKQFELMIYPQNRHAISNPEQNYHLYRLMTEFLHEHLQDARQGAK